MSKLRVALATGLAGAALVIIPAGTATAHVHGINPLECTPAPSNAGANRAVEDDKAADVAGLTGVIPRTKSGKTADELTGGNDAPVCD